MLRKNNTDRNGNVFTEQTKLAEWNKAQFISGYDSAKQRKDGCGACVAFPDFH